MNKAQKYRISNPQHSMYDVSYSLSTCHEVGQPLSIEDENNIMDDPYTLSWHTDTTSIMWAQHDTKTFSPPEINHTVWARFSSACRLFNQDLSDLWRLQTGAIHEHASVMGEKINHQKPTTDKSWKCPTIPRKKKQPLNKPKHSLQLNQSEFCGPLANIT